jgi:protein SCO1/2
MPVFRPRALLALFVVSLSLTLACSKKPVDQTLPKLGKIGAFSLTDQSGKKFSAAELHGKVWVAAFFFTRCRSACPIISHRLRALQKQEDKLGGHVHLVSFSVDPENDTPAVMTAYAKQYHANLSNWSFLTGDYDGIKKLAGDFKMALEGDSKKGASGMQLTHASQLGLVDGNMQLRGYYSTKSDADMKKLASDALRLSNGS